MFWEFFWRWSQQPVNLLGNLSFHLWGHNFTKHTHRQKYKNEENFLCNLSEGRIHIIMTENTNSVPAENITQQGFCLHVVPHLTQIYSRFRPRVLTKLFFSPSVPPWQPLQGSSPALISSNTHHSACQPSSLSPGSLPHWFPAYSGCNQICAMCVGIHC